MRAAVAACQRALAIQPDLQPPRNNLALAYAVGGRLEAQPARVLRRAASRPRAHYNIGIVQLARRQYPKP